MNTSYSRLIPQVDPIQFKKLVEKNLKNIKEVELLILKGHTLIEFALNEALQHLCYKYSKDILTYTYSHKVQICGALGLFEGKEGITDKLKLIGRLRNQIAHNLTFIDNDLNQLFKYYTDLKVSEKNRHNKEVHDQIILIMAIICGNIFGRLEIKIEINNYIHSFITTEKVEEIRKAIFDRISKMAKD